MNSRKNILPIILSVFFVMSLILPNLVMLLGIENTKNNEHRKFKELPDFNLKKAQASIRDFKNYYVENFGLKTSMVNNYINFKSNVLNETPIPHRVVEGKDGWYFLGNEDNNTMKNVFGNALISKSDLQQISKNLKELINYCKQMHIKFYVVVPPDKNRIYKEYLPYELHQHNTKLSIIKAYIKKELGFEIIDLGPEMMLHKKDALLYFKTDTHWNEYGAFIGYSKTLDIINGTLNIPKKSLSDYNLIEKKSNNGDIISMINSKIEEPAISFELKNNGLPKHSSNKLKLIMHHDSFAYKWMQFFNESFDKPIYTSTSIFDKSFMEKVKPDIIIFEIVERNIDVVLLNDKKPLLN